jgi:signal transduction histidine kinase
LNLPPLAKSLSVRLLLLTVAFVMLAEVLIYAPSIGRFRLVWLQERLAAAHLAILALEATPDQMVSEELEKELMSHVGAFSVALTKPDAGRLMLMVEKPSERHLLYDLREDILFGFVPIRDAAITLLSDGGRLLRVLGPSPKDPDILVEIMIQERPLRTAMLDYSQRILILSLVISLFTAALVYLSLHLLMVRPMRRITASMTAFRDDPENSSRVLPSSDRTDEIGVAQRELVNMQEGLRAALLQKNRLAALGTAVTKINHDLKNILATAILVSDRLAKSDDPQVRSATPTLVAALDRAVKLCAHTLNFTREGPPVLDVSRFDLRQLVAEVAGALPTPEESRTEWDIRVEAGFELEADREQLFRVLHNLGSNATQAAAAKVAVSAHRENGSLVIDFQDNGPGLPPRARQNLFQPFSGAARKGGTGLGLAIARDLMHAHGGDIRLVNSSEAGTLFRLTLPATQAAR